MPTRAELETGLARSDMLWEFGAQARGSYPSLWHEAPFVGNGMVRVTGEGPGKGLGGVLLDLGEALALARPGPVAAIPAIPRVRRTARPPAHPLHTDGGRGGDGWGQVGAYATVTPARVAIEEAEAPLV